MFRRDGVDQHSRATATTSGPIPSPGRRATDASVT